MRRKPLILTASTLIILVLGALSLNNNLRLSQWTRAEFEQKLDRARDAGRDWLLTKDMSDSAIHRERLKELLGNPALLYMLIDCDQLSGEHTYAPLIRAYFAAGQGNTSWDRMVDPSKPFIDPDPREFGRLLDYQRWFLWAMAPDRVTLATSEKADLDSPDRMRNGRLTHQIFTWRLYRRLHGATPEIDRLIRHLCERAAHEASLDFRVTDMYLQRIAFILDAGHPDLIRPRWVERAVGAQQDDGGWTWAWFGWGPQAFQFRIPEDRSSGHPTAQGVWITYLLKYRYPDWIKGHYR